MWKTKALAERCAPRCGGTRTTRSLFRLSKQPAPLIARMKSSTKWHINIAGMDASDRNASPIMWSLMVRRCYPPLIHAATIAALEFKVYYKSNTYVIHMITVRNNDHLELLLQLHHSSIHSKKLRTSYLISTADKSVPVRLQSLIYLN